MTLTVCIKNISNFFFFLVVFWCEDEFYLKENRL